MVAFLSRTPRSEDSELATLNALFVSVASSETVRFGLYLSDAEVTSSSSSVAHSLNGHEARYVACAGITLTRNSQVLLLSVAEMGQSNSVR
jgi:hypothetical protein